MSHPYVQVLWNGAFERLGEARVCLAHAREIHKSRARYMRQGLSSDAERQRRAAMYWEKRAREHVVTAMGNRRDAKELRRSPELMALLPTEPPPSDVRMVAGE